MSEAQNVVEGIADKVALDTLRFSISCTTVVGTKSYWISIVKSWILNACVRNMAEPNDDIFPESQKGNVGVDSNSYSSLAVDCFACVQVNIGAEKGNPTTTR
ncbi:hypothetical protein V6N11_047839 [Hibiscus sabdariffa]|uniref:Uncharacterized protein n=2 Tax=Hibiscus sabdariffa TaxID=183260 RepID=A0ABR2P8I1_9ROSI